MRCIMVYPSATQEEWSAFSKAIRRAHKDIAAYDNRLVAALPATTHNRFDFNEPAPQFQCIDDANEHIQRLWSVCASLSDKQQQLKERVEQDSSNSSRPPSCDTIAAKVVRYRANHHKHIPTGRAQGAQPGHTGRGRALQSLSQITTIKVCPVPEHCAYCGEWLATPTLGKRKQVSYLKDKRLTITEYHIMKAHCKQCKRINRGKLPAGTPKGAFGSCVLSIITLLTGRYRLSKRQTKACLQDLFGLKLSVGTISNIEHGVSEVLSNSTQEVHAALKVSALAHVDETTHYHKHQLHWLWLLSNSRLAYVSIYRYRDGEMARCLLGEVDKQKWVTDRYGAYGFLPKKRHQYCWSHLKRDIQAIVEHSNPEHACIGKRLEAIRQAIFTDYRLSQATPSVSMLSSKMKGYLKQFRQVLREGAKLSGKKTAQFCKNLIKNWRKLWNFLTDRRIPATNNHAERMIRHNVLWRKVSLGTQSCRGDRYVERISTVHLSCRLQERDLLEFIKTTLDCFWLGEKLPSLLVPP